MKVLREKFMVQVVTVLTLIALLNVSLQFDEIMNCFAGVDISYLLIEELPGAVEGETEKGTESISEIDLIFARENHTFQTQFYNNTIGAVLHSTALPPHPHLDTVSPPPKVRS